MEHSKGILEAWGQEDFVISLRLRDKARGGYLTVCSMHLESNLEDQEEQNKRAQRLVTCWNFHQDLVDLAQNIARGVDVDIDSVFSLLDELERSVL